MTKRVAITGVYRSGTTYIQQLLNDADACKVLYQPFFPIFKEIDETIRRYLGLDWARQLPLGATDYLGDLDMLDARNVGLDRDAIRRIEDFYRTHAMDYRQKESPEASFFLHLLEGLKIGSVQDIWLHLFDAISQFYPGNKLVGFKELFMAHHLPLLLKFDRDVSVLCLIRDPREVYFSRLGPAYRKLRHPVLMAAELWKKYAKNVLFLTERYPNVSALRYDDFSDDAFKHDLYTRFGLKSSGPDLVWKPNTSGEGGAGYGKRWETEMPAPYVSVIERICSDEMGAFGYDLSADCSGPLLYEEDFSTVLEWARLERYASWANFHKATGCENKGYDTND